VKAHSVVLSNGIRVEKSKYSILKSGNRVIFCARLDRRKGVDKFIELAQAFQTSKLNFEIYGPDGGELPLVLKSIEKMGPTGNLKYHGSIKSEHVQDLLKEADLLVLPSRDEPFPMVILEALAVGTHVLVMPSCGFAKTLKDFNKNFVSETEDIQGLINAINQFLDEPEQLSHSKIQDFCRDRFSIESVCSELENFYSSSTLGN
jgi:glycosyltransferase involved in cell wall biosynthesis